MRINKFSKAIEMICGLNSSNYNYNFSTGTINYIVDSPAPSQHCGKY